MVIFHGYVSHNQMVIEEPNLFFSTKSMDVLLFKENVWGIVMAHFQYFLVRLHVFLLAISSKMIVEAVEADCRSGAWNPSGSVWR